MKKSFSIALILLAIINIFAICATTVSVAGDAANVIPAVPENVVAVNSATGVSITWEQVDNTAGYKIYRCARDTQYIEIGVVRGYATTSFIDESVKSGKTYTYKIKAYNAYNESEFSSESEVVYLKQPTIKKAISYYGGIKLSWERSNGAESYTVYRKNGNKNKAIAKIEGNKTCTFLDKNIKDNNKYQYTVVAHKGIHRSSFVYKTSDVYITAPTLKKTKISNGYVTVYWEKTKTADKYRVYRKTSKTDWEYLGTAGKNSESYKDKTVKNATTYQYTVRAVDGSHCSGIDREGIKVRYISTPKNITLDNYFSNTIRIKWGKVSSAEKYIVYRKDTKNTNWKIIKETAKTQYIDSSVVNGREYTYAIRAVGKNNEKSAYLTNQKITALKAPSKVNLYSRGDSVVVSWSEMNSASGYRVYRKLKGESNWSLIAILNGKHNTTHKDINVEPGKTYLYTVRQVNGDLRGSYNKDGYAIKYIVSPKVTAKLSPNGVVLRWSTVNVGSGYLVQRKAEGEQSWKTIAQIKSSSVGQYVDSAPVFGKKNYYRIFVNGENLVSDNIYVYGINPKGKVVALTYDDGPYTPVTNQILDMLEKYNSRATFFVVGSRVATYKDCIKREAAMDCEIGNHTYNHTILTSVSATTIKSEISRTNEVVKQITGQAPKIVRTPGGAVNSTVKANVDYPMFNWSVDTLDWKYRNSSSVVSYIKNNVRDGSIVLMHDLYGSTGDATEIIVPWLIQNGYQLVTVSELMEIKGIDVQKGQLYTKGY